MDQQSVIYSKDPSTPPVLEKPYDLGKLGISRDEDQQAFAETVKRNNLVNGGKTVLQRGKLHVSLNGHDHPKGLKAGKETIQLEILHGWILEAAAHKAGRTVIVTAASVEAGRL